MFHLCRNQVNDLHLYLKFHSSTGIFKHFASKNQLPGFYISGTLVENGSKNMCEGLLLHDYLTLHITPIAVAFMVEYALFIIMIS